MPSSRTSTSLKASGECWTWGYGQNLGNNTITNANSPVQIVGGHYFIQTDGSFSHSMGVKDNGTTWAWGTNSYGELGLNNIINYSSPVQVVGNHSFIEVFCGYQCSIGLKNNGQVWCWGRNNYGQMGNTQYGNSYSSPVQVVGNHSFVRIFGASESFFGIKNNCQVWGWGRNQNGQLGVNNTGDQVSPVQIVGNHSFVEVKHSGYNGIGLKQNGQVWCWGQNSWGQIGDNTTIARISPVQVVGNHSFVSIATDYYGTAYGLKSNGQVWSWGVNSYGSLGIGVFATNYSSPVQVVGNHSFIDIYTGSATAIGLKSNGSVWMWGRNDYGQCGTGIIGNSYNSPIQVIGNHSFTKLMTGMSIKTNVSGVWRKRPTVFVNISGSWMRVSNIYTKQSGVWNKTDAHGK